jgi:hypothetical protein
MRCLRLGGGVMVTFVPQDVLGRTTDCPYDVACLSGTGRPACKVIQADGKDVLFIEPNHLPVCPYVLSWGTGAMCRCPTHYYLHRHRDAEA